MCHAENLWHHWNQNVQTEMRTTKIEIEMNELQDYKQCTTPTATQRIENQTNWMERTMSTTKGEIGQFMNYFASQNLFAFVCALSCDCLCHCVYHNFIYIESTTLRGKRSAAITGREKWIAKSQRFNAVTYIEMESRLCDNRCAVCACNEKGRGSA